MSGRARAGVRHARPPSGGRDADPRLDGSRPARRSCDQQIVRAHGRPPGRSWSRRRERRASGGRGERGVARRRCTRRASLASSSWPEPPIQCGWLRKKRERVHPLHGNGLRAPPSAGSDASRTRRARSGAEPIDRVRGAPRSPGVTWLRVVLHRLARRRAIGVGPHATRLRGGERDGGVPGRGSVGLFTRHGVSRPRLCDEPLLISPSEAFDV